jgi:hypothetical protein
MTVADKRRLNAVASLPCAVCGATPCNVHHVRRYGETRKHSKTIPLCYRHHQGADGIHTLGKKAFCREYGSEEELLQRTNELLREAM